MSDTETFTDPEKPTVEEQSAVPEKVDEAPAKEEAKAPAKEAEGDQPRDEKGKWASSAVAEERNRRKEIAAQLEQERAERKAYEARVEKRFQDLANPPKPPPDPRQDFNGYMDHKLTPIQEFIQESAKDREQRQEREREVENLNTLKAQVVEREVVFRKTAPDYDAAAEHWKAEKVAELEETGLPRERAVNTMLGELKWMAAEALAAGKNPAEVLYGKAKRLGYKAAAQVEDKSKVDQQFDAVERAARASRSLGATSGSAPTKLSVKDIAEMSDDEYAHLVNTHGHEKVRRMLASLPVARQGVNLAPPDPGVDRIYRRAPA